MNNTPKPSDTDDRSRITTIIAAVIGAIAAVIAALISLRPENQLLPLDATSTALAQSIPTPNPTYTPYPFESQTPSTVDTPISISTPNPAATPVITQPITRNQGELYVNWPTQLKISETNIVFIELLTFTQTEAFTGSGIISVETLNTFGERSTYTATIAIYPIMDVELLAPGFAVEKPSAFPTTKRELQGQKSVAWIFQIQAKSKGSQVITLVVHGQDQPNATQDTMVLPVPMKILVTDNETALDQAIEFIKNNAVALCSTGGPIGLFLLVLAYKKRKKDEDQEKNDSYSQGKKETSKDQIKPSEVDQERDNSSSKSNKEVDKESAETAERSRWAKPVPSKGTKKPSAPQSKKARP